MTRDTRLVVSFNSVWRSQLHSADFYTVSNRLCSGISEQRMSSSLLQPSSARSQGYLQVERQGKITPHPAI